MRIDHRLRKLSAVPLTIVVTLATNLVLVPFAPFFRPAVELEGPGRDPFSGKLPLRTAIVVMVLIAPLLETFIFQTAVIRTFRGYTWVKRWPWAPYLLSAVVFGVAHGGGYQLFIVTFAVGLVLAYGYYLAYPGEVRAFAVIASAHAIHNAVAVTARALSR